MRSELFVALGVVAACPPMASAALIGFDLQIRVDEVIETGDVSSIPDISSGITAGVSVIHASFFYDNAEVGSTSTVGGGTITDYTLNRSVVTLPSRTFEFGGAIPTGSFVNGVSIRNNVDFGFGVNDQFVVANTARDGSFDVNSVFGLCCNYADTSVFTNTDPLSMLDLGDFGEGIFTFDFIAPDPGAGARNLRGSIVDVQPAAVPEPSTLLLVLSAFLLLGKFGRRSSARA